MAILGGVVGIYTHAPAQEKLTGGGYYKNFSFVYDYPAFNFFTVSDNLPISGSFSHRLRLKSRYALSEQMAFHAAYEIFSTFGRTRNQNSIDSLMLSASLSNYRVTDLEYRLYPSDENSFSNINVYHDLDRLYLSLSLPSFDLYVGRQAIAWGSARVINPTDVIAPFWYTDLDTEDRRGVDAVRVRVPLGSLSELDAGYVFGKDFKSSLSAAFIRTKFPIGRADYSFLLMDFKENLLAGFDVGSDLFGAGYWLEAAYVFENAFISSDSSDGYFRLSTGCDYSFPHNIYGFIEYHYNSAGQSRPENYLNSLFSTAYCEGSVYLLGQHYLIPGFTAQLTPLLILSAQALVNLNDVSFLFAPALEYSIAEDVYVAAGFYVSQGKKATTLFPASPQLYNIRFNSEFGSYPDVFYSSFRYYF